MLHSQRYVVGLLTRDVDTPFVNTDEPGTGTVIRVERSVIIFPRIENSYMVSGSIYSP